MSVDRLAAWASGVAVIAAVIAGFVLSGTPLEQRLKRLDASRVSDLQQLSYALDAYWEERQSLPGTLDVLVDGRRLSRLPVDPVTREPYSYRAIVEPRAGYRLCATFALASDASAPEQFWSHPAGQHCYEFEAGRNAARVPALRR